MKAISISESFLKTTPRETLQHRGQFWTPDWVGRAMARYVLGSKARRIFDPAVGAGALLISAKQISEANIEVAGFEIYPEVLKLAKEAGLTDLDLSHVQVGDYLTSGKLQMEVAIICNPPYIRHHKLKKEIKLGLRASLEHWLGVSLDGRLGLHGYFLLQSLRYLRKGGRLAYITSADLYEGKSSQAIWAAITSKFRIEGVVTFETQATPFPKVDTNPVVCLISAEPPSGHYKYIRAIRSGANHLEKAVASLHTSPAPKAEKGLLVEDRKVQDYLSFGLARPRLVRFGKTVPLGRFIRCMRGIATGANTFFFLTEREILQRRLPKEFFVRAVGRTRDVPVREIVAEALNKLNRIDRPTWLLNLRGYSEGQLPASLRSYLRRGEELNLATRPLIRQRNHWYWIEQRTPPPFFFAYLGRRNVRFIRNRAGVQALTGFLYVYPQPGYSSPRAIEILWSCMQNKKFLVDLDLVAKTYGGGALKVEPRALERTPVPLEVIKPLLALGGVKIETQLVAEALVKTPDTLNGK